MQTDPKKLKEKEEEAGTTKYCLREPKEKKE
jgi:hypothetical protein